MKLKEIMIREKLYLFLLAFIILANFSLHSVSKALEAVPVSKIFDKEMPQEEDAIFNENIIKAVTSKPVIYMAFLMLSMGFLLLFLAGIIIDGLFLCDKIQDREPIAITQAVGKADWGILEICKVIIIFFFAESVAALFTIGAALFLPNIILRGNIQLMIIATALDVVAVGAIFYFVLIVKKRNMNSLGLTAKNFLLNVKYGITAYIGLVPVFLIVTIAMAFIFKVLNIPVEPQEVVEILKKEENMPSLIYMCLFTSLLGPVMEEIFFRGFVYGALKNRIGILGGVLVSAAFFAYVHANAAGFVPILSLGILLAYIYEKTGSLVSSVTAHIMHNSAMLVVLLFLKSVSN
ncbi:MAG: type II CAAX endopeptidase family protein [Candidatus Omnitrophota bacterium]